MSWWNQPGLPGEIRSLAEVSGSDLDAVILPGGFGAAKNLSDFAVQGSDCSVDPEVLRVLTEVHQEGKPIGVACIAPVVAARLFGMDKAELTIGDDVETAEAMVAMGAVHHPCGVEKIVVDTHNRLVSTPAYMKAGSISEASTGIRQMVEAVLEMVV